LLMSLGTLLFSLVMLVAVVALVCVVLADTESEGFNPAVMHDAAMIDQMPHGRPNSSQPTNSSVHRTSMTAT